MANLNSVVSCVFIIIAFALFSLCDANEDNPKIHIVYMGTMPDKAYDPTSHHLNLLQQVVDHNNPSISLIRSFKRSFNGFAASLTNQQVEKLSQMEGVVSVFPSQTLQTHTTRSWDFLGIPNSVKRNQSVESDLVIGVIDTGIWPESDSFNDQGFNVVPKKWKGTCASGKNFTCNKKIIGARFYVDESARDLEGHGSHTASTAAGNSVNNVGFYGLAQGTARGGVPSARVAAYKVCNSFGCDEHSILAAFDDAIADGVDIISVSLGRSSQVPFDKDVLAIGSFHAMAKGILTVNSAGNDGPSPRSTPSLAPWLLSVAANTIDRQFIDKVILGNGETLIGNSINSFSSNGTKIPIALHNGDSKDCPITEFDDCTCLDSDVVKGKKILCPQSYGVGAAAKYYGAYGVITHGDDSQGNVSYVTLLPSLPLNSKDFGLVQSYKRSTEDPKAEILKTEVIQDQTAPRVAAFSSRGPNTLVSEILKPDISAPGVDILAAYSPAVSPSGDDLDKRSVKFNIISGTSMSCPHISGIATYLKTFHQNSSPSAIKSAIMTSAIPMNNSISEIGEYAYGSGQVNPVQAVTPGLVYDIDKEDYIQMLCNMGYDAKRIKLISGENKPCSGVADRSLVRNLNYPALAIQVEPMVPFNVTFRRTVTNVGASHSKYTATIKPNPELNIRVTPKVLFFKTLNQKLSFVVTIVGKMQSIVVLTSSLVWSDGTHNVRSPIVVDVSIST